MGMPDPEDFKLAAPGRAARCPQLWLDGGWACTWGKMGGHSGCSSRGRDILLARCPRGRDAARSRRATLTWWWRPGARCLPALRLDGRVERLALGGGGGGGGSALADLPTARGPSCPSAKALRTTSAARVPPAPGCTVRIRVTARGRDVGVMPSAQAQRGAPAARRYDRTRLLRATGLRGPALVGLTTDRVSRRRLLRWALRVARRGWGLKGPAPCFNGLRRGQEQGRAGGRRW